MDPKKVVRGKFRVTENKNFNPKEAVPFALSILIGAIAGWYILPKVWGDSFTEKYIYSNDKINFAQKQKLKSQVSKSIYRKFCLKIFVPRQKILKRFRIFYF